MKRLIPSVRTILTASAAFGALVAAPAMANETAEETAVVEDADDEVVVTARRRAERLLDVPVAVTAMSAAALEKMQATDLSGIQGSVPNLNIVQGRGSSSNANIFIRGIGQPDALQTFDPAVGIYVDGIYMSRVQGALFGMFDVERVEVLRGPQGTLYGKNTVGGAVNVVTRKPHTASFTASGSVTYGSYDQVLVNGYVSTPLIEDKLALSLAGVYDKRDGVVTDPLTGREYNDRNSWAGRAILRATPSESVELILSGDYYKQRNAAALGQATAPLSGLLGFPQIKPAYPYGEKWDYRASTSLGADEGQRVDHWGVGFTANIALSDALTLTSITGYRKLSPDYYLDFDATEYEVSDAFVGVRQEQFSQELQLKYNSDNLSGVFGLYYLNEDVVSHQEAYSDYLVFLDFVNPPLSFVRYIDDEQNVKSFAAFGQLTYEFDDKFSVTGGLRYSKERKKYHRLTTTVTGGVVGGRYEYPNDLPAPYDGLTHVDFEAWTPTLSATYKLTPDAMIYASASRGFKSGGFNGRVNGVSDVTLVVDGVSTIVPYFKPETVWTYEVGSKASFLGGRVQLAGDVFHSTYKDFQARVGGGSAGAFPVVNAGEMRIWGIELEATLRPVRNWNIRTSFGYLNAEYKEFNDGRRAPAYSCNPTGNEVVCEPPFAPPISFSLASDYRFDLGQSGSLTLGGDARFVDKHHLAIDNRPGLIEDGYWLVNAFVQYDAAGGRYYLRGGVKNLTKSIYKTDGQEFSSIGNIQTAYYGDPRTFNVTAGFRF